MGDNHIIIQEADKDFSKNPCVIPEKQPWEIEEVNCYTVTSKASLLEIYRIVIARLYRENYMETIFKDLLISLSSFTSKNFKRIKCRGEKKQEKVTPKKSLPSLKIYRKILYTKHTI